jgi:hypothetical protein
MLTKRKTSTIPFGYKESDEKGFLEEIPEQLQELEETKKHIMNGSLSLRGASEQLEHKTGRKISYVGLKKIVDKSKIKGLLDKREV